ncbi:MAG TPA: hypothetical protein VGN20_06010 [Mucilaginibacter sp.]|jgi:hypothetical protein
MELTDEVFMDDRDNHSKQQKHQQANGYRVDDKGNVEEKNLERSLFINSQDKNKPVMEGRAMGGGSFGKNNLTPSGDDKNNPSQYAGHSNAYLALTEPAEEHPEDSNFKVKSQDGTPDYSKAQPRGTTTNETPKPEKVEPGNGENDRPHKGTSYQEGTVDNDEVNIPGPNELPDQQKVGEGGSSSEKEHIET